MKKILFAVSIILMSIGCKQTEKTDATSSSKNADTQALYEQNLSTLKTFISDFEKEDIGGQAALIADSAWYSSAAFGDTVHTKEHWLEGQKFFMDNNSNLHLSNAQFLPGIDSATHQFDGSVRYYGTWSGVHSTGVASSVKFYGTYDFNKDHKIISGNDFFDLGGMMNNINSKGK